MVISPDDRGTPRLDPVERLRFSSLNFVFSSFKKALESVKFGMCLRYKMHAPKRSQIFQRVYFSFQYCINFFSDVASNDLMQHQIPNNQGALAENHILRV